MANGIVKQIWSPSEGHLATNWIVIEAVLFGGKFPIEAAKTCSWSIYALEEN